MPGDTLSVVIVSPQRVLFEGEAHSVTLPGENGVFEILPFHKNLISRLLGGKVILDNRWVSIRRGSARLYRNQLTLIVEEAEHAA